MPESVTDQLRAGYPARVPPGGSPHQRPLEFEPEGKAAQEIRDLYTWLCGQVGMSTHLPDNEALEKQEERQQA
jgi:hypothetical protein